MSANWTKLASVGRFVFGLAILAGIFWVVPTLAHVSPSIIVAMMSVAITPLTFLIYPITIAGIYFVFTSKFRWRIDVIAIIIVIIAFYGTYQFINPLSSLDIGGNTTLNVTVLTELQKPVVNLEVDLAEKAGPPPSGGTANTNNQGVATFSVKPGDYVVYFNTLNFPKNLEYPQDSQPVHTTEGKINQATVVLKSK